MQFKIFKRTNEFYWSNNKVIYSILFICLGLLYLKNDVLEIERNLFDNIIFGILMITFCCAIILKFIGFTKTEPLGGNFIGNLIFHMDSIQINDEIFPLETIRNIEISNNDYLGKLVGISKGNFNGALSNGTNNTFKMKLYSREVKIFNFEICDLLDFIDVKQELINYYLNGKLEFENLANLLSEKSCEDKVWLKKQIEEASTNR